MTATHQVKSRVNKIKGDIKLALNVFERVLLSLKRFCSEEIIDSVGICLFDVYKMTFWQLLHNFFFSQKIFTHIETSVNTFYIASKILINIKS